MGVLTSVKAVWYARACAEDIAQVVRPRTSPNAHIHTAGDVDFQCARSHFPVVDESNRY